MSRKKKTIKLETNPKEEWEVSKGHMPHRGGGGLHKDRRTKRARTRKDSLRKHLKEEEDERM